MGKYFGTDGIRGRYGIELTNAIAFKLGQSLKSALNTDRLVIGMDTRESSSDLLYSVISGAQSVGIDVMNAGVLSTPLISYFSFVKKITGVMITASHNPYHDNGIKVFDNGIKLTKEKELLIETFIDDSKSFEVKRLGELFSGEEVFDLYLDLIDTLDLEEIPLRVGVDSANGANYLIAKGILEPLVADMIQIGNKPDGKNINDSVGSTNMNAISELVREHRLDLGLSFDGDGDRILVVDNQGNIIDGDLLIYIIACYLQDKGLLEQDKVVLTKMSNLGIVKAFEKRGIEVLLTDVGDKYVVQALFDHNLSIGGENSGHIIVKNYLHTGDGLLVGLLLLKILHETGKSLQELLKDVTMWPQELVNIRSYNKEILEDKRVVEVVNEVTKELGKNGKVLVRASGTEPLLRVTLSCETQEALDQYMNRIVGVIQLVKEEV